MRVTGKVVIIDSRDTKKKPGLTSHSYHGCFHQGFYKD